jgi:hypothetical protein
MTVPATGLDAMICASVYLLVFIRNLLVHTAEKILPLNTTNFRGDYPILLVSWSLWQTRPVKIHGQKETFVKSLHGRFTLTDSTGISDTS